MGVESIPVAIDIPQFARCNVVGIRSGFIDHLFDVAQAIQMKVNFALTFLAHLFMRGLRPAHPGLQSGPADRQSPTCSLQKWHISTVLTHRHRKFRLLPDMQYGWAVCGR